MKKIIILLIATLMIFAACTPAEKETADAGTQKPEEQTQIKEETKKTQEPTEKPSEDGAMVATTPTPAPLSMKVAIALPMDRFAEAEFNPVIDAVINAGYMPVILGEQLGIARIEEDNGVEVRDLFSDHSSEDLRGIIVIGGSDSLWENEELSALLLDMHENGRLTAAICLSSVTLAKAGIIGEGDTASWFNCDASDAEMQAAGVADSGQAVTADGLIITGDGPSAAEQFAKKVVEALDGM